MLRLRELKKQLQEDKDPNKVRLLNRTFNPKCIEYLTVSRLAYMMASIFEQGNTVSTFLANFCKHVMCLISFR